MPEVKITYRGWVGHFICAHSCRFRLNTLIEYGDKRVVVSTVGLMEDPLDKDGFREIGFNRHYETMAFIALRNGDFWDADVKQQVYFDSPWSWPSIEDEWAANKGHIAVVEEIAGKLERGELLKEQATA